MRLWAVGLAGTAKQGASRIKRRRVSSLLGLSGFRLALAIVGAQRKLDNRSPYRAPAYSDISIRFEAMDEVRLRRNNARAPSWTFEVAPVP